MRATRYVADFDSASAMLRATARFLEGRDFPQLGMPHVPAPLVRAVNRLPVPVREAVYRSGGFLEAVPPRRLSYLELEALAEWAVSRYPCRRYPAVAIGSANGALVHLCAALGIPWLPQTLLVPVRQRAIDPDRPRDALARCSALAAAVLARNPEVQLHHMHDANQDRLMIRHMAYFRFKWRRLGEAYTRFLEAALEPGGTLIVVDCRLDWPTTQIAERHVFQHGALGGAEPEEYRSGGERVAAFLARQRAAVQEWDGPEPDGRSPEAEWGFEPALLGDLERLASSRGWRLRHLAFRHPEDLSPVVADLHRWWYERAGALEDARLVSGSFILLDPRQVLETRSIPWWAVFNVEQSAARLEAYLDERPPFDHIDLMLFSHGVESIGLAGIERWRSLAARARRNGRLIGVDERCYPRDFAAFANYQRPLRALPRHEPPPPLTVSDLDGFLGERGDAGVEWGAGEGAR